MRRIRSEFSNKSRGTFDWTGEVHGWDWVGKLFSVVLLYQLGAQRNYVCFPVKTPSQSLETDSDQEVKSKKSASSLETLEDWWILEHTRQVRNRPITNKSVWNSQTIIQRPFFASMFSHVVSSLLVGDKSIAWRSWCYWVVCGHTPSFCKRIIPEAQATLG